MSGDREFVQRIFPKIRSLMDFCLSRLDADGFAAQVEDDWIFIDWADMDKTGAVCAEQLEIRRPDLQNRVVQQHIVDDLLPLKPVRVAEQQRKYIGMPRDISLPG